MEEEGVDKEVREAVEDGSEEVWEVVVGFVREVEAFGVAEVEVVITM